jgi:hypothetical protein
MHPQADAQRLTSARQMFEVHTLSGAGVIVVRRRGT